MTQQQIEIPKEILFPKQASLTEIIGAFCEDTEVELRVSMLGISEGTDLSFFFMDHWTRKHINYPKAPVFNQLIQNQIFTHHQFGETQGEISLWGIIYMAHSQVSAIGTVMEKDLIGDYIIDPQAFHDCVTLRDLILHLAQKELSKNDLSIEKQLKRLIAELERKQYPQTFANLD